jgi:hypothetical protein
VLGWDSLDRGEHLLTGRDVRSRWSTAKARSRDAVPIRTYMLTVRARWREVLVEAPWAERETGKKVSRPTFGICVLSCEILQVTPIARDIHTVAGAFLNVNTLVPNFSQAILYCHNERLIRTYWASAHVVDSQLGASHVVLSGQGSREAHVAGISLGLHRFGTPS